MFYKIFFGITTVLISSLLLYKRYQRKILDKAIKNIKKPYDNKWKPKKRNAIINDLKNTEFDILVIGGGSTGTGCALDAVTRGLTVGLVEANDFGFGTSSKSTKLLHGGIRYLEKAVNDFDKSQFKLVKEALSERKTVMNTCPFLSRSVEILFPVYKRILVPYYYIGLKIYDWIAGIKTLGSSKFLTYEKTVQKFPHIRKNGLIGSVSYLDGQFYDAKFNVLLALTSAYYGATVANHVKVKEIIKDNGKIVGVKCYDKIGKCEFDIRCKILLNATGSAADELRSLSNQNHANILQQSYGTHIVVPALFSPKNMGFVDPNTSDGRVAFFMNYKGKTLIGATDIKCTNKEYVTPTQEDLDFLIHEANHYTDNSNKLTKDDVLAIWTGIRPLIKDPSKPDTEKIVRKHIIKIEDDNLVTITGGKWTIYRLMAEQALDTIISYFNLEVNQPCITKHITVIGSDNYTKSTELDLAHALNIPEDIAKHLATSYGTKAFEMKTYFNGIYSRLTDGYPFTKEEILYCLDNEMAYKISDILLNRFLLGYIDVRRAFSLVKVVGEVLKEYYSWDQALYEEYTMECVDLLKTCGYELLK